MLIYGEPDVSTLTQNGVTVNFNGSPVDGNQTAIITFYGYVAPPTPAPVIPSGSGVMNFGALQARLNRGVLRADLAPYYGDYINQALIEIQNRRSWTCMKVTEQVTLGPGGGYGYELTALQNNFKELRRAPAINFIADDGGMIPAKVVFEEEEIFRVWAWSGCPMFVWPPRVFLVRGAPTPTQMAAGASVGASVGIVEPLIETFNLSVNMFAYLPALSSYTDTSPLLTAYPSMVLAKAKAITFSEINDPQSDRNEAEFERHFHSAAAQDAYSEVAGRKLRM